MSDPFIQNPELLLGTPKLTVAGYVERHGIAVPRRYASLEDAMGSGHGFIARSEHPLEYAGPSGLFSSFVVDPNNPDIFVVGMLRGVNSSSAEWLDSEWLPGRDKINLYSRYSGENPRQLIDGLSFSFWEHLGGCNKSIVADSAIEGRYHFFVTWNEAEMTRFGERKLVKGSFITYDNGQTFARDDPPNDEIMHGLLKDIRFYEQVRALFDPANCPLVEMQTFEGGNYFLQYHRGRDFSAASFSLTRGIEEGEFEAYFVRGCTPPEGRVVGTKLLYEAPKAIEVLDGLMYLYWPSEMLKEVYSRNVSVHFDQRTSNTPTHANKSALLNPPISIILESDFNLLHGSDSEAVWPGEPPDFINVRVISDGRRCLVKRMT